MFGFLRKLVPALPALAAGLFATAQAQSCTADGLSCQPPYTDAQAYTQAQNAISSNLSGPINMAAGSTVAGAAMDTVPARQAAIAALATVYQPIGVGAWFVTGFTPSSPGAVATLLSGSPCNSSRLAQYAVVSDLYSTEGAPTNEVMRCGLSGSTYYWRPQRTDYVVNRTTTGGTVTLGCLTNAPTQFVSGTLVSNLTLSLATANCWPGAEFDIANGATLGVFGITVANLIGGTTKTLGLAGRMVLRYDGIAWQAF